MINILILAAGYGTRLYPLTLNKPKSLLEVKGRPILEYIIEEARKIPGLFRIFIVSNEKFYFAFRRWLDGAKGRLGENIKILNDGSTEESNMLGAIGDIYFAVRSENIAADLMVLGGDNLFRFNLAEFASFAREKRPHTSIGIHELQDKESLRNFGIVSLGDENIVTDFQEKPEMPKSSLVGMCLYYFPKESMHFIAEYVKSGQNLDQPGHYINWLHTHDEVFGFPLKGRWFDIGSKESYELAKKAY